MPVVFSNDPVKELELRYLLIRRPKITNRPKSDDFSKEVSHFCGEGMQKC